MILLRLTDLMVILIFIGSIILVCVVLVVLLHIIDVHMILLPHLLLHLLLILKHSELFIHEHLLLLSSGKL